MKKKKKITSILLAFTLASSILLFTGIKTTIFAEEPSNLEGTNLVTEVFKEVKPSNEIISETENTNVQINDETITDENTIEQVTDEKTDNKTVNDSVDFNYKFTLRAGSRIKLFERLDGRNADPA